MLKDVHFNEEQMLNWNIEDQPRTTTDYKR